MSPLRKVIYLAVTVAILLLLVTPFLYIKGPKGLVFSRVLMGTLVEITINGIDASEAEMAALAAFDEMKELQLVFGDYLPASDVSRVNASAGSGSVRVDPRLTEVVNTALHLSKLSFGAFDPTLRPLATLWKFTKEPYRLPLAGEIKERLDLVDYNLIKVSEADSTVGLEKAGMGLGLGGVAWGYIVGAAVEKLKEYGVGRATIKVSGDKYLFDTSKRRAFTVGIPHPRKPEELIGDIRIKGGAVSTSGDYESFFIKAGRRFHHIIDPQTGYPASKSVSVTIISKDFTVADALSAAVFILGPEKGMALLESFEEVEGVIISPEGRIRYSKGLENRIKLITEKIEIEN